jgi:ligand-binding sensor domain-containing protein
MVMMAIGHSAPSCAGSRHGKPKYHTRRANTVVELEALNILTGACCSPDHATCAGVLSRNGLDRFRDLAVATFSGKQGISNAGVGSVLAHRDGSVWLGTPDGVNRWTLGKVYAYRQRAQMRPGASARVQEVVWKDLPNNVGSLFLDDRARLWVFTIEGLGYLDGDRFISISGVPGGVVHGIAEDTSGNLWITHQERGLFRLFDGKAIEEVPWASLGRKDHANALIADPSKAGLWLGFYRGGSSTLLTQSARLVRSCRWLGWRHGVRPL